VNELIRSISRELNVLPLTASTVVMKLTVAFLCSFLIALLYRKTYRGPGYSVAYTNMLILLSMTTAIMIMVIGNNLARAFGIVGALSVVRFRHAVKNTQDIVFVFLALAVGMASGVGFYTIAITGTLFIGLLIFLMSRTRFSAPRRDDYLLQFNYRPGPDKIPPHQEVLDRHCRKLTPINVRTLGDTEMVEMSYYVRLRDKDRGEELIRELNRTRGIEYANIFFDEEQI